MTVLSKADWRKDMQNRVDAYMQQERQYWRRTERLANAEYRLLAAEGAGQWFWQQIVHRNTI